MQSEIRILQIVEMANSRSLFKQDLQTHATCNLCGAKRGSGQEWSWLPGVVSELWSFQPESADPYLAQTVTSQAWK